MPPPPPPSSNYPPYQSGSSGGGSGQTNGGLLAASIIATILCCLPAGIVAIVYSTKGEDDKAKMWIGISVVLGVVAGVILFASRS